MATPNTSPTAAHLEQARAEHAIGGATEAATEGFARYLAQREAHEAQFVGMTRAERTRAGLIARVGETKARAMMPHLF